MASADLREELNCSICLSIYTDPVNLRCGHSYCRGCIDQVLDAQRASGVYSCPECRKVYTERPELQKNISLCNIAQRFLNTHKGQEKPGICCTYCIHSPVPAVKSCLMCEACLCENHLRVHSKLEEHVLVEPSTSLATKKCPIHKMLLEYYCTQDQVCICVLCKHGGKHYGHQVEMICNAANKKKERLRSLYGRLNYMNQETVKSLQTLQKNVDNAKDNASCVIQRVTEVFSEIMDKLQRLEDKVIDDINKQVEQNTKPTSSLIQKLELKRDEWSSKLCHVEELCSESDPLIVLQEQETHRGDFCFAETPGPETCPIPHMDDVLISLQLHKDLTDIVTAARNQLYVPANADIDLDEDTAASNVDISADLKIALGIEKDEDLIGTSDSFESHQVLSLTSFDSGKHYWEVDIHGSKTWRIGMSYDGIAREGEVSVIGNNEHSWCVCKAHQGFSFRHNGDQGYIYSSIYNQPKRLGIYLDYEGGWLSFYNLDKPMTHLHTFRAVFTEPLYAAIRLGLDVWVKIIP